ncbi:MAG TPA: hypothetical protein VGJ62_13660 [Gemmatimonadaceae bacterium]
MFFRTAASLTVVAAALLSVSCAKKENTPPEKPERPAEVSPPKEGATTNLDSLRAYLDTFYHGDLHRHLVPAICADKSATTCRDSVKVTIQAIGLSKDIKSDSGPARGRVIGQMRNLDSQKLTELDSLKPATQADYYIYIDRATDGHARWNLLEVPNTHTGTIRRIVQNNVRACNEKPGYGWLHSDVDFANCGEHALDKMVSLRLLTATGLIRFAGALERYLRAQGGGGQRSKWYGCNYGCCV